MRMPTEDSTKSKRRFCAMLKRKGKSTRLHRWWRCAVLPRASDDSGHAWPSTAAHVLLAAVCVTILARNRSIFTSASSRLVQ